MHILSDLIMLGLLTFCGMCDLKHRSIPMWMLALYSLVTVWLTVFVKEQNKEQMITGLAFGFVFWGISFITREAIGYGDSWLITILGFYLGFEALLWVLLTASLCACLVSLTQLLRKQWNRSYTLPFVPFMILGFAGVIFS